MKDKVARRDIRQLEIDLHNRIKVLERTGLTVKNCPKCGHLVLAQAIWAQHPLAPRYGELHQCLTCGVKFSCEHKSVCEVVTE